MRGKVDGKERGGSVNDSGMGAGGQQRERWMYPAHDSGSVALAHLHCANASPSNTPQVPFQH